MTYRHLILACALSAGSWSLFAQTPDSLLQRRISQFDTVNQLQEVKVVGERGATYTEFIDPVGIQHVTKQELFKAACCNLSESFETNPAVDAAFTDAVTGTKQIEMLGLAGKYVQFTLEAIPGLRGLAVNQGLNFIPGSWLDGLQVSKGTGSVVNGFEASSGQINLELKKPTSDERFFFNTYVNQNGRLEFNANSSLPVGKHWATATLLHYSTRRAQEDMNHDGFLDFPTGSQVNLMHRWSFHSPKGWEGQYGVRMLRDQRIGGHTDNWMGHVDHEAPDHAHDQMRKYTAELDVKSMEVFAKTGYVFPGKPYQSIGLQLSTTLHDQKSLFGQQRYDAKQYSGYGNLIFQTILGSTDHTLRTGLSYQWDRYDEQVGMFGPEGDFARTEAVAGAFAEYSYDYLDKFNMIAGIRMDYNNLYGWFATPRLHLRYSLFENTSLRLSVGRGQRTANIFAENTPVFASSRVPVIVTDDMKRNAYGLDPEVVWNYGGSLSHEFTLGGRAGTLSADFFHTRFQNQVVVDMENPREIRFYNLDGESYSNSLQFEVNYPILKRLELRMAYRWLDVKTTYEGELKSKPLTAAHRAFASLDYTTRKGPKDGRWMFNTTLQWLGQQRLPDTSTNPEGYVQRGYSPDFFTLNAQVTKSFRDGKFDVYLGGENLLGFTQKNPIVAFSDPYGPYFDSSLVWGPIAGRMFYAGLRYKI